MRLLSILIGLLVASGGTAAQNYSATPITSPNSNIFFANLMDLNNKGQVLGDACNANCGVNRFPAVWANGVYQALPIPSGYQYGGTLQNYKINDSGDVVGTALLPVTFNGTTSMTSHVVLWQNVSPTRIEPSATLFPGCVGTPSSTPSALNSSGHILILSAYTFDPSFNGYPGPCYAYWIYPTGSSTLSFPFPPQCLGLPGAAAHPMTYDALPSKGMNDADQVLENILNSYCGPPYVNPAPTTTYDPAVIQPGRSFSFLPASGFTFGGGSGARAEAIDNLGIVQGFADNAALIWDSSGVHVLGPGLVASLNNVGQALYAPGNSPLLWQNGVSTPIQLPPGLIPAGPLNDAGQFTATDGANGRYLVSPSGACGQDVTLQTQLARGGFRYNHTTTHFTQAITVTNAGGSAITGPISLAFDNLPAKATVFGISGATQCLPPQGSQYINLGSASLASGSSASSTLQFINTERSGISYQPRVITGAARR